MDVKDSVFTLFGGSRGWNSDDWTASDDRVRGGKSQSYLDCTDRSATFRGTLDIKTLGGAGFASQRTTGEDREWDLSDYDGIQLNILHADDKQYTLTLKDELLPKSPNGREQSTVSWEYDFKVESAAKEAHDNTTKLVVPWEKLQPTYRGRNKEDAPPLDLKRVKRISIMMRSFFGTQEGPFHLELESITAITAKSELRKTGSFVVSGSVSSGDSFMSEKAKYGQQRHQEEQQQQKQRGWFASLFGLCGGRTGKL